MRCYCSESGIEDRMLDRFRWRTPRVRGSAESMCRECLYPLTLGLKGQGGRLASIVVCWGSWLKEPLWTRSMMMEEWRFGRRLLHHRYM